MTVSYYIKPVGGKFSWSVRSGEGAESGVAPTYGRALEEVNQAKGRLDAPEVILNPKADPNVEHIYHWADRARGIVSEVAGRRATSTASMTDLSRAQRLLDNILKEIDG